MTGITGYGDYKRVAGTGGKSTERSAGRMPGDLPYLPILVPGYRACLNPSFRGCMTAGKISAGTDQFLFPLTDAGRSIKYNWDNGFGWIKGE